jgi:hypothetical protein
LYKIKKMVETAQKEKIIEQIQKVEDERLWQQIELLLAKFESEYQEEEMLQRLTKGVKKEKLTIERLKKEQGYKKMTRERWEELVNIIDMDESIEEIENLLAR